MTGEADWSIAVGIFVFIVAVIIATIYYLRYKKVFIVAFTASIATYVFAVFYTWDVFLEQSRNWVLLMLAISTLLMIYLGKYFSGVKLKHVKVKK